MTYTASHLLLYHLFSELLFIYGAYKFIYENEESYQYHHDLYTYE